jgi:hypothetical protein
VDRRIEIPRELEVEPCLRLKTEEPLQPERSVRGDSARYLRQIRGAGGAARNVNGAPDELKGDIVGARLATPHPQSDRPPTPVKGNDPKTADPGEAVFGDGVCGVELPLERRSDELEPLNHLREVSAVSAQRDWFNTLNGATCWTYVPEK